MLNSLKNKLNPKQKPVLFSFSHHEEIFCHLPPDTTSLRAEEQ